MEAQSWIIIQIVLDILIAVLLIGFIRFQVKLKKSRNDPESIYRKSDEILSEMRKLSETLNQNLEEKRELSRKTLSKLDNGLRQAEKSVQHIQDVIGELGVKISSQPEPFKDIRRMRSSVNELLAKGVSREEVARHLGISLGEMELLSKFQHPQDDSGIG